MSENNQLSTVTDPFKPTTFEAVKELATQIAESGMYGIKKPAQAVTLMMMAQEENTSLTALMRRIHVFEDGKISQRADYTQGEFEEKGGKIIWHVRTDELCAGTFLKIAGDVTDEIRKRADERFNFRWRLEIAKLQPERDRVKENEIIKQISKLAREGEETIVRTLEDMEAKGVSQGARGMKSNWLSSSQSMLQWRCVTQGVKVVWPALMAGLTSDVEIQDLHVIEDANRHRITATLGDAKPQDREAIEAMIAQHQEELKIAHPERRKTLLGLVSELRCALADIEVTEKPAGTPAQEAAPKEEKAPAETAVLPRAANAPSEAPLAPPTETIVEPPVAKAKRTRKITPEPQPAEIVETPWQQIVCHLGKEGGAVKGKTLGELFDPNDPKQTPARIKALMDFFHGSPASTGQDITLRAGVEKGYKAWEEATTPKTASAPAKSTPAPASAAEWEDFVIESMNPVYSGKRLGDFKREEIQTMLDEQFQKIKWETATQTQKKWRAMAFIALAEEDPLDPPKIAPHIAKLNEAITRDKVNRNDLLAECKRAGWINREHRAITDITPEEVEKLLSDWNTVVEYCNDALPK